MTATARLTRQVVTAASATDLVVGPRCDIAQLRVHSGAIRPASIHNGQFNRGARAKARQGEPRQLTGSRRRKAAAASGNGHLAVTRKQPAVVALECGTAESLDPETDVTKTAKSDLTAIAAGYMSGFVLKTDCSLIAWGDTEWGQAASPAAARKGVVAYGESVAPSEYSSGVLAVAAQRALQPGPDVNRREHEGRS